MFLIIFYHYSKHETMFYTVIVNSKSLCLTISNIVIVNMKLNYFYTGTNTNILDMLYVDCCIYQTHLIC
jgi:hypothetical protein